MKLHSFKAAKNPVMYSYETKEEERNQDFVTLKGGDHIGQGVHSSIDCDSSACLQ